MKTKAYSYVRFSTKEQLKGDSLRRQKELSENYAAKHNLDLDNHLNMFDLGISGFKSDNLTEGALGKFLDEVDKGNVRAGSYLLIENIDRLSRDKVPKALRLFTSILEKKIIIVTLFDERKYDIETINETDLLLSILSMSRAHDESLVKSKRKTESWSSKFKVADHKKITKWSPPWVYLQDNEFRLVDDRVDLVQSIFQWVLDGKGLSLILKEIEQREIKPWGHSPSISYSNDDNVNSRAPKRWYTSRIERILKNRQVLGEFVPRKNTKQQGDVIFDYYPKIIDEDTFEKVQRIRRKRNVNEGIHVGRRGKNVTNLFSGLIKCGYSQKNNFLGIYCDQKSCSMKLLNKGHNSTRYLHCSKLNESRTGVCTEYNKYVPYNFFEYSVLRSIEHSEADEVMSFFKNDEKLIRSLYDKIDIANSRMNEEKNLQENIFLTFKSEDSSDIPDSLRSRLRSSAEKVSEYEQITHDLQQQVDERSFHKEETTVALTEIRKACRHALDNSNPDQFDDRLKLSEFVRKVVMKIEVFSNPSLSAYFTHSQSLSAKSDIQSYIEELDGGQVACVVIYFKSGFIKHFLITKYPGDNEPFIIDLDKNTQIITE